MAYTFTAAGGGSTVYGNQRVIHGVLTADGASGVVSFGLGRLVQVQWSPKSMTTNNDAVFPRFRMNAKAAGTASLGDLGVSGVTSGDEFYVTIFGV